MALKFADRRKSNSSHRRRFFDIGRELLYPTLFERDRSGHFDRKIWKEMGFHGLFDPDATLADQIEAYMGLAQGSMDIPFTLSAIAHGAVAVDLLVKFGSDAQKRKFLPGMIAGETIAAVCNAEDKAGTDVRGIGSNLILSDPFMGDLDLNKRGATNLSQADLIFASVWRKQEGYEPALEVVILETKNLIQESHVDKLAGFKTGLTGSIRTAETLQVNIEDCQLGPNLSGYKVLKHCFNIERLFISAIVAGALDGLLRESLTFIKEREAFGKSIAEYQYVQEKVISIYSTKEKILGLVYRILNSKENITKSDLSAHNKNLALLKMNAVEDGYAAVTMFYEIFGYQAYKFDHLAQKAMRDIMALKFLGGTKEQQKIILFADLMKEAP